MLCLDISYQGVCLAAICVLSVIITLTGIEPTARCIVEPPFVRLMAWLPPLTPDAIQSQARLLKLQEFFPKCLCFANVKNVSGHCSNVGRQITPWCTGTKDTEDSVYKLNGYLLQSYLNCLFKDFPDTFRNIMSSMNRDGHMSISFLSMLPPKLFWTIPWLQRSEFDRFLSVKTYENLLKW